MEIDTSPEAGHAKVRIGDRHRLELWLMMNEVELREAARQLEEAADELEAARGT
jgi:hypothetical protein